MDTEGRGCDSDRLCWIQMGVDGFAMDTDGGAPGEHERSDSLCWIQIGVDGFVMDTDGGAPRGHLVVHLRHDPCGHTVWTLFNLY